MTWKKFWTTMMFKVSIWYTSNLVFIKQKKTINSKFSLWKHHYFSFICAIFQFPLFAVKTKSIKFNYDGSFIKAKNKLVQQTQKALYSVYRKVRNLCIPVDLQLKLFDSIVLCLDVWTNRQATSGVYAITVTTSAYHGRRCGRL
jgi:hypothetical protein